MAFPTPPSTTHKAGVFMPPSKKLTYYEDVYRKHNADEEAEGHADQCESSDSDDDGMDTDERVKERGDIARGFFHKYTTPKSTVKTTARRPEMERYFDEDGDSDGDGEVRIRGGQGRGQGIFNFLDSRLEPLPHSYYESSEIYRTAPNTSPKRSIATHTPTATPTNKRLKLTPRKFGMFASSTTDMPPAIPEIEYDEEFQNEAGEAMDDLLGPETTPVRKLNFGLNRPTFAPLPLPTPTSAFDGDVEDNQDLSSDGAEGDAKAAIRAFKPRVGRSKRSTAAASLWEEIQRSAEKALQTVGRERRDSVVAGRASPRLATRGEVKLMGERTAFLKKGMEGRVSSKGEVLKRGMRLRNWRGELIGDGEAIVVVRLGEVEDVGEFERLFD